MSAVAPIIEHRKRGPKVGQKHSGQFRKGHDSRRAPPIKRSLMEQVAEAAQESAPAAIAFLTEVMNGESHCIKTRLVAAKEILDRSIGQSVSMNMHRHMTESENEGSMEGLKQLPARELTDAQLLEFIQSSRLNGGGRSEPAVDAEFTEVPPAVAANKTAD